MKANRLNFVRHCARAVCLVSLALAAAPGCSDGGARSPAGEEEATEMGRVGFALTGLSTSGKPYRLVGDIVVTGALNLTISTEEHLDQSVVSRDLPVGGYLASLEDWTLETEGEDGTWTSIRARLISTTPLPFVVEDQETTSVTFRFKAGDQVIELGNGRVNFGIAVEDGTVGPNPDCAQTCGIAQMMLPECEGIDSCQLICGQVVQGSPPQCRPVAEQYAACSVNVPGEGYVCFNGYPIAGACEMVFAQLIDCFNSPPPPCMVDADMDGSCSDADCDDQNAAVFPGAVEQCNLGIDFDCDGVVCDCIDADLDGSCSDQDCDDQDPGISPNNAEFCGDGIDQNCNGSDLECLPPGWTCDPAFYGALDGCDCGCGAVDPDCSDATVTACTYCDDRGSCAEVGGCALISPMDNSVCQ